MSKDLEVIVRQAGRPDRVVPLNVPVLTLGRSEDNELVLPDIGVSRKHARLHLDGELVTLEDLGSGNGTWCRGRRITGSIPLKSGDIVLIDPFTLELRPARKAPRYTPASNAKRASAGARLDVVSGPALAQGSYLVADAGLSVGRSEYRDLVLLDPAASRHHCDVVLQNGHWRLVDRGSSNGVQVNDVRVTDAAIHHGDILRIGNTELRFVELEPGAAVDEPATLPRPAGGVGKDLTQDLSLPLPNVNEVTPKAEPERRRTPNGTVEDSTIPMQRPAVSHWLPISIGAAAVGALALAGTLIVGIGALLTVPRTADLPLIKVRAAHPPPWTLKLPAGLPETTVPTLFDQGVQAMRDKAPDKALESFYRVLLAEPGNRAAERWSFTAGEHMMLDTLQTRMIEARDARIASEAERDTLLDRMKDRDALDALRTSFRDDPVVLSRTGWAPSPEEAALARAADQAMVLANDGGWSQAEDEFNAVLDKTRNPVLEQRARLGRNAARQALASQVALAWRSGVIAEMSGDLVSARRHFRRVLQLDPKNPSAIARIKYLGDDAPGATP